MSCPSDEIILETRRAVREVVKGDDRILTVDAISFRFKSGGLYNLVGPSGSGKSSYLRLLNRLDEATSGEILFGGRAIQAYRPTDLRRRISMLFQTPYLFPGTVEENIRYCCRDGDADSGGFLERVGLPRAFLKKDVERLSVGEKQRVALSRSLALNPEVLLLDEPTSALDPASSRRIEELILSLARDMCLTVITVTHNPEQAIRLGGETLLIVSGRLVESGRTSEVLTSPTSDPGRKYIDRELS